MNTCFRLWSLGSGLIAAGPALRVQPLILPADAAPAESVLKQTTRLIREDAAVMRSAGKPEAILSPADTPAETVLLEPFVVTERKTPAIPPPLHETRVQEFLRTGTIAEHIGKKVTTGFRACSNGGLLGFAFSW